MTKKHWFVSALLKQADKEEDLNLAESMRSIASRINACGSKTIWEVANKNYVSKCNKAIEKGDDWRNISVPKIDEYVEWAGEVGGEKAALHTLGLARCNRIQCPICCYVRTILRRNLAIEWAASKDFSKYYIAALTFTVPHKISDSKDPRKFKLILENLDISVSRFSKWFTGSRSKSKKLYLSECPESLGFMTSLEFTFGSNGLHPHYHSLFFTQSERDIEALNKWFKRDRVRVWKSHKGRKIERMPNDNEDRGFIIVAEPHSEFLKEKVLSYINKGLFETLSYADKDEAKKDSKTIFELSGDELRYFCTFFEATKGKRFYRSGGICKEEIRQIKDLKLEDKDAKKELNRNIKTIIRIGAKEGSLGNWLTSEFVRKHQLDLEKRAVKMSAADIKKMVVEEFNSFKKEVMIGFESVMVN